MNLSDHFKKHAQENAKQKPVSFTLKMPLQLYKDTGRIAAILGVSRADFINITLKEHINSLRELTIKKMPVEENSNHPVMQGTTLTIQYIPSSNDTPITVNFSSIERECATEAFVSMLGMAAASGGEVALFLDGVEVKASINDQALLTWEPMRG